MRHTSLSEEQDYKLPVFFLSLQKRAIEVLRIVSTCHRSKSAFSVNVGSSNTFDDDDTQLEATTATTVALLIK